MPAEPALNPRDRSLMQFVAGQNNSSPCQGPVRIASQNPASPGIRSNRREESHKSGLFEKKAADGSELTSKTVSAPPDRREAALLESVVTGVA